jgi:nitrogen regulatory protein PII
VRQFDFLCCIVNHGSGTKILNLAKKHGIHGGTILLGHGTVPLNKLMEFFELADSRKEIVIMLADHASACEAMAYIGNEMSLHKKNSGICFISPANNVFGVGQSVPDASEKREDDQEVMYNAIYTIVQKGMAEDVVDAARAAGARGGTIINARGSGANDTMTVFAMPIEPEREIVLILADKDATEAIAAAIRGRIDFEQHGAGILFVLGVSEVYGLARGRANDANA